MAESMIERVARALADNHDAPLQYQARAAIEAMKRPVTDEMIIAGTHSIHNGRNVSEIFDDMIDAALKETQP